MTEKLMLVRLTAMIILASVLSGAASLRGEDRSDSSVAAPGAKPKSGKVTGIVTAKTSKFIAVKPEGAQEPQRYLLAKQAGGEPSADVRAAMKTVFRTNLVVIQWEGEQEPVVRTIQAIHSKTASGMTTGTVVAVELAADSLSFDLKPSGRGFTERYMPHADPTIKSWEQGPARAIAGLNVGDKVKVTWVYDERKHPKVIQVIRKAQGELSKEQIKK